MKAKFILVGILSLAIMTTSFAQTAPGKTKTVKTNTKKGKTSSAASKGSGTVGTTETTVPTKGGAVKTETTAPGRGVGDANPAGATGAVKEVPAVATSPVDNPFKDLEAQAQPVVKETANGQINYTGQYVEAKGSAVIDNDKFKNPAQARLMAERGAIVVAQRNLLEMVKGVNVIGETTVQDMVTTGDYVYSRVEGIVKGAKQVGPSRENNGAIEVTLRMPLYDDVNGVSAGFSTEGLENARRKTGISNENSNVAVESTAADGSSPIAFNIKGTKIDPSMFPVIVDENGKLLLDFSKVYQKTGKVPKIIQSTKDIFEATGFKKGTEIIDLIQGKNGALTLADPAKKGKVNWAKIGDIAGKIGKVLLNILL